MLTSVRKLNILGRPLFLEVGQQDNISVVERTSYKYRFVATKTLSEKKIFYVNSNTTITIIASGGQWRSITVNGEHIFKSVIKPNFSKARHCWSFTIIISKE